eukprot:1347374-Amorphochlora_amoeboformis.AAC.1
MSTYPPHSGRFARPDLSGHRRLLTMLHTTNVTLPGVDSNPPNTYLHAVLDEVCAGISLKESLDQITTPRSSLRNPSLASPRANRVGKGLRAYRKGQMAASEQLFIELRGGRNPPSTHDAVRGLDSPRAFS